jgi:pyruvate kinase
MDYVAVSFPRTGADIRQARQLVRAAGSGAWLIAKIERAEAVADDAALDDLIRASDGVMVARGDLGVEIGDARLAGIQKRIIRHARTLNKLVITATQMMESMVANPIPTRAEVSDVANAVLDYTDAVMLSAETAIGQYPVEAVQAMARICLGAEQEPTSLQSHHRLGETFSRCDETIALASMYAANHFPGIKAIISLTESGHTPLIMSRIRSGVPIYCYTRHVATQRRAALFRGVYTIPFDAGALSPTGIGEAAIDVLRRGGLLQSGDWVILTQGELRADSGGTNGLKILQVR